MQANYGPSEIKSLLSKVKIFNNDIGTYEVFAITDSFDYAVKLSNGRIVLKIEELQDDERDALTQDRLTAIANRFVSSSQTNTAPKTEPIKNQQSTNQADSTKKKSSTGKILLFVGLGLAVLVIGLIVITNMNNGGGSTSADSYQEQVMSVEEIERSQPTNFISADGTYRETFWGDKIKVNCVITNNATVASYKDAIVRVTYYTKTKTELGTKEYTIYEIFPPHSKKTVELKIENFKDVASIGWDVINATPN